MVWPLNLGGAAYLFRRTSPKGMVVASRREYIQFLSIAQGSLKELETQTILAQKLDYSTTVQADRILSEAEIVGKLLGGLIRSLKAKDA
jgi:four helix bundle protein